MSDVTVKSSIDRPICWLLVSELFPLYLRAKALSVATFVNRITASTIVLTFYSMARAMSFAGYFGFFSLVSLVTFVFVFVSLPETKGKTLEEITVFMHQHANGESGINTKQDSSDTQSAIDIKTKEGIEITQASNPIH